MFRSGDGSEEEGMEGSQLFHSHLLTGTQLRGEGAGTSVGALAAHARETGLWVTGPGTARGLLWGSAVAPSPMEGVGQGHPPLVPNSADKGSHILQLWFLGAATHWDHPAPCFGGFGACSSSPPLLPSQTQP